MPQNPCPQCSADRAGLESACTACGWVPSGPEPIPNPYANFSAGGETPPKATSLIILGIALLLTELFAAINTMQEGYPLAKGGLFLITIAGLSQLPGIAIAFWRWKWQSRFAIPLLWGAYAIAFTGTGIYATYAMSIEPADSMNSAAHMHVIAFPVLHCMLALLVYLICGIFAGGMRMLRKPAASGRATSV